MVILLPKLLCPSWLLYLILLGLSHTEVDSINKMGDSEGCWVCLILFWGIRIEGFAHQL